MAAPKNLPRFLNLGDDVSLNEKDLQKKGQVNPQDKAESWLTSIDGANSMTMGGSTTMATTASPLGPQMQSNRSAVSAADGLPPTGVSFKETGRRSSVSISAASGMQHAKQAFRRGTVVNEYMKGKHTHVDDTGYVPSRLRKTSFAGIPDPEIGNSMEEAAQVSHESEVGLQVGTGAHFYAAHAHLVPGPEYSSPPGTTPMVRNVEKLFKRTSGNFRFHPSHFSFRHAQSLYGPYTEKLPKKSVISDFKMGSAPQGRRGSTVNPPDQQAITATLNSLKKLKEDGSHTLADIAEGLANNSRAFWPEWHALQLMRPTTLAQIGAKMNAMTEIANEFAQAVSQVAVRIIEERNASPSAKVIKPLPSFDHVFVVQGNIYVISETPARVSLYGSREAAHRAALNELRAVRTLLGAPFIDVKTPLCCTVTMMGFTVFVSAPIPSLEPDVERDTLVYGGYGGYYTAAEPYAMYTAHQMAEYLPIAKHKCPDASKDIYTGADVKQIYSTTDGSTMALDLARWLPPAVCQFDFSKSKVRDDVASGRLFSRHPVEDVPLSYLSVQFRPEYLRHTASVTLNPDACTPHQPATQQENIGYALHQLYTHQVTALVTELTQLYIAGQLEIDNLSTVFHSHGVNMRYLGRVYLELEVMPTKTPEVRDAIKQMLAIEAAARTWKAVLFDEMADLIRVKTEEELVVNRMQLLLMALPDSSDFWENQMKDMMEAKFGFFQCPAVAVKDAADGSEALRGKLDPNSLKVYHAIRNTRIVVEEPPSVYVWKKDDKTGLNTLDADAVALTHDTETTSGAIFALLGPNARENAALMHRALQLTKIDFSSDIRGKRIIVTCKPKVKSCVPLIMSPSVAAMCEKAPSIVDSLASKIDNEDMCDAVENAARGELHSLSRHSESDPRQTLPLWLTAMAQISSGNLQSAYQTLHRLFDMRKTLQVEVITGSTAVDLAPMFLQCRRIDRAETVIVEGLKSVRFAPDGVDAPRFCEAVFVAGKLVGESLFEETNGRPNSERLVRVLEYLHYAARMAEKMSHPRLPYIIDTISEFRSRYSERLTCASCGAAASVVVASWDVEKPDQPVKPERDNQSLNMTTNTRSTAATVGGRGTRQKGRRQREKIVEDDAVGDLFTRSYLGDLDPITHELVPRPSLTSDDLKVMTDGLLQGITKPNVIVRPHRYACDNCAPKSNGVNESIWNDPARMLGRAVKLLQRSAEMVVPVADATYGSALVSLGFLNGDPKTLDVGISSLSEVYGPESRPVVRARLQLADVLVKRSSVESKYSGPTRDVSVLNQAEQVLRGTLMLIVNLHEGPSKYSRELAEVVRGIQRIIELYSTEPVAKREHQTLHWLVDTLKEHLGAEHPLLGAALGQIKSYYVMLSSTRKNDSNAAMVALQTAGDFACDWLYCRANGAELGAADDLDSYITVIRDDIVKVLRSGGPTERNVAVLIAERCEGIINASPMSHNEQVRAALRQLQEVFKAQLKVIEQSERTQRALEKIDDYQRQLHQCVQNIKKHSNGTDRYSQKQVIRMGEIRDEVNKLATTTGDPHVADRAHTFSILHDTLLKLKTPAEGAAKVPGAGKNRSYQSPYAFLGTGESLAESKHEMSALSGSLQHTLLSSRSFVGRKATQTSTDAFVQSAEQSGCTPQTVKQLSQMYPTLNRTSGKKNFSRVKID